MSTKDYYKTLGVEKNATQDEIKKAYKKLVVKHHPDRNKENKAEAEKKMKEINEAYEILSNPEKRSRYDHYGDSAFSGGQGFSGFRSEHFGDFDFSQFGSVFEEFFGGSTQGGRKKKSAARRGSDLKFNLHLTLEECFKGVRKNIEFDALDKCDACDGTGSADKSAKVNCPDCNGHGSVRMQQGFFVVEQACGRCQGTGEIIKNPCRQCRGSGVKTARKKHVVEIPAGIQDGMTIQMPNLGDAGQNGGPAGTLYVAINVKKHSIFARKGDDLACEIPIMFTTLALGGEVAIPTIDGKQISLKIPEGTQTGTVIKASGHGMSILRSGGRRGDLYVSVKADTPKNLNKEQKDILKKFAEITGHNNHEETKNFFDKVREFFSV